MVYASYFIQKYDVRLIHVSISSLISTATDTRVSSRSYCSSFGFWALVGAKRIPYLWATPAQPDGAANVLVEQFRLAVVAAALTRMEPGALHTWGEGSVTQLSPQPSQFCSWRHIQLLPFQAHVAGN